MAQRKDGGYDFGMDRPSLRDLVNSALPLARGIAGDFWDVYVEHEQEMLYPLELFAAIALECHGLSRYAGSPHTFLQLSRHAALRCSHFYILSKVGWVVQDDVHRLLWLIG